MAIRNSDAVFAAIEQDRKLEAANDVGLEALARHRWHWTLDESNPDRVTITEYAQRAGRVREAITRMVNGYDKYQRVPAGTQSLADLIATAGSSEQRATVIREVAKATGWTPGNVAKNETRLIRDVRDRAEERAAERGTTVDEEIPHVAATAAAVRQSQSNYRKQLRATKSRRLLAAEGRMATVLKALREMLQDAEAEDFDTDEIEMILKMIRQSRAFLGLVEVKLTGDQSGTDWDAELQRLGGVS